MDCARALLFLLILFPCVVVAARPYQSGRCMMSRQTVKVQRDVVLPSGRAAVCFGTATAASCQGACPSFSVSSIHDPTGFTKKCTCCREKQTTSQTVILSPCFDPDNGQRIKAEQFLDEFQQPSGCECQPCSI